MAALKFLALAAEVRIFYSQRNASNALKINNLTDSSAKNGTKAGRSQFFREIHFIGDEEFLERKKMYLHFIAPRAFIEYRPCVLTKGKDWYITYYAINPSTGKMKRFRVKCNRARNQREKIMIAQEIMTGINERLSLGWNPFENNKSPRVHTKLFDCLDSFLDIKGKETEKDTLRTYKSFIKTFKTWIIGAGLGEKALAGVLDKRMATVFMDDLEARDDISPRTYNNYLTFMHLLYGWMVAKGYSFINPFEGMKKKARRCTKKKRRPLTNSELSRLFAYLETNNPEYLVICYLCYCCLMRPKEIAMLRCSDIKIKEQLVYVRAEVAKNDNSSYRTIPNQVLPAFRRLDLSNPDNYVFGMHRGNDFRAGKEKMYPMKISHYWNDCLREACALPMEVQFYSLKDTGITNLAEAHIPINIVQQQADHSSLAITSIYMGRKSGAKEELKKVGILPKK